MNRTRFDVSPVAGALLVLGAVGFTAVFAVLAVTFGYPDVLGHPASEVLPALIAGGPRLRIVWTVYAILPVTLAAAVLLAHDALPFTARAKRMVTLSGALASAAMIAGLARWPSGKDHKIRRAMTARGDDQHTDSRFEGHSAGGSPARGRMHRGGTPGGGAGGAAAGGAGSKRRQVK